MGIECVTTGRNFTTINQPVSLMTVIIVFLMFAIVGGLAIGIYKSQADSRITFCRKFVSTTETAGTDHEVSYVICVLATVVLTGLSILSFFHLRKNSSNKLRDSIFPGFLLAGAVVAAGLAYHFEKMYQDSKVPPTTLAPSDTTVQWCMENREALKDMYLTTAVIYGLGITMFVIYLTDLVTSLCVVY